MLLTKVVIFQLEETSALEKLIQSEITMQLSSLIPAIWQYIIVSQQYGSKYIPSKTAFLSCQNEN